MSTTLESMSLLSSIAHTWQRVFSGEPHKPLLHFGELEAQSLFGSCEQAGKLAGKIILHRFEPDYAEFIQKQDFFFIATSDRFGRCDCSFRSIDPEMKVQGYPAVCIQDETTLLFPDLSGNGLFQSLGNLLVNPHIGMLFINFETAQRVRVNGRAEIIDEPDTAQRIFGPTAQRLVKVHAEEIFANCPKRIPKLLTPDIVSNP